MQEVVQIWEAHSTEIEFSVVHAERQVYMGVWCSGRGVEEPAPVERRKAGYRWSRDVAGRLPRYQAPGLGGEATCIRGLDSWIPHVKMKKQNWVFVCLFVFSASIRCPDSRP